MSIAARLRDFELRTKPVDPHTAEALQRRWDKLPAAQQIPSQVLGRRTTGCEGTHGVFPKCDFACKPCYHSSDANKVRVDGEHTLQEVTKQMSFLRDTNATTSYAQLIGGEVSLLDAKDHADSLQIIIDHGRKPMSFSHGDFDYDYLRGIALDENGERRFDELSFACHMDTTMVGRSGLKKPTRESEMHERRAEFCEMFDRLEAEHGVRSFLAHNMTVTPTNIDQIADVVATCWDQGWRMFSFQPAAYIGHEGRWADGFRELTSDIVWGEVERGVGSRLPYEAIHVGDTRCTRSTWGTWVGDSYVPFVDDQDSNDRDFVAEALETFPGNFINSDKLTAGVRIARSVATNPSIVPAAASWARRFVDRAGGLRAPWRDVRPMTFVMHQFIDAKDTGAAWEHIQLGTRAEEPKILEAQERLEACAYIMGHPELDQSIPACVQHAVYDPNENSELVKLLPLRPGANSDESQEVPVLFG